MSYIYCIFGVRGSGKTTLVKSLSRNSSRVLIYDPLEEYDAEKFYSVQSLGDALKDVTPRTRFRFSFVPTAGKEEDGDFLAAYARAVGDCTVVYEEIDLLCSPHYLPDNLSDSIRRGRHYNVSLIAVSRSPAEVSRLLTSQAHQFYIFRFSEPRQIDYFRARFGDETAEKILLLNEHRYIRKIA